MCTVEYSANERIGFKLKFFREFGEMGNHGDMGSILDRKDSDC